MSRDLIRQIKKTYNSHKQKFGHGKLYQSYEPLGIKGERSTAGRFDKYRLSNFLSKKHSLLDIGCNCGFFSLYVSRYVYRVDAFDNNASLIEIAKMLQSHLRNTNVNFYVDNFDSFKFDKYDVVISAAIHKWSSMDEYQFHDKILSLLKPRGLILLEGHDVNKDKKYKVICNLFKKNLEKKHSGFTKNGLKRNFSIWSLI